MWGVPACLFLFAFFHRTAPGVFAKELMQAFGATGATIGLLSATYFYAYAGLMIPAGVLLDRMGVRWVVTAGGLVMGAGTLLMAVALGSALLFDGRFPVGAGAYALFLAMGLVGGAFVLTWPLGREVNPPELAGIAVGVVNLGAFAGAALTQGPLGALLDARWAGETVGGARVYPVEAYRASFAASAILILCASLISLFFRETRGRNVYADPRHRAAG